eukprot:scaffold12257_cov141-Isochrysis_galbana.AAC.2
MAPNCGTEGLVCAWATVAQIGACSGRAARHTPTCWNVRSLRSKAFAPWKFGEEHHSPSRSEMGTTRREREAEYRRARWSSSTRE